MSRVLLIVFLWFIANIIANAVFGGIGVLIVNVAIVTSLGIFIYVKLKK